MSDSWLWLDSGSGSAAFNMALDEALLEAMPRLTKPVLRFYGWIEPAASFGYFQKFSEVERATLLRPLVRRPTGGGLVPHDSDWTYGLIFPAGHEWHSLKAIESYRRVHEWLQAAFAKLKIATELAACGKKLEIRNSTSGREATDSARETNSRRAWEAKLETVPAGQCFVGYEKFDLLWNGRKVAGAAQRRNKLGLLIQGSVQPPPVSLSRMDWQRAVRDAAEDRFDINWTELKPDAALRSRAESLADQKYSQGAYNQRR